MRTEKKNKVRESKMNEKGVNPKERMENRQRIAT